MKTYVKKTLIALAVSALFGTSLAYANGDREDPRNNKDNQHSQKVDISKRIHLSTDVRISGDPMVTGTINTDSAAIAVIDNQQSVSSNAASNTALNNNSSISDNVANNASGNIGMNVAAGDNNAQDNAAALSATDASFAFGMADGEVFVNQAGMGNATMNSGVNNTAGVSGNAFQNASGNIGVNVASGNNNEQKNALAASVATTDFAQSSISSNQVSSHNQVSNAGYAQEYSNTTEVSLSGAVQGYSIGFGEGHYAGRTQGSYSGSGTVSESGNAYQSSNFYPDTWTGTSHPGGNATGHIDFDNQAQGAVQNPNRPGVGGFGFDTASAGTTTEQGQSRGTEQGGLGFIELSASDLYADLSGSVVTSQWVMVNASNSATLSGNAFQNASGNIGVNVASGTGNLQANSLALAVAQPSTGSSGGGE
ncbi:MAG: hypothetical protein RSP_26290 [Rhodanobacter sp.]